MTGKEQLRVSILSDTEFASEQWDGDFYTLRSRFSDSDRLEYRILLEVLKAPALLFLLHAFPVGAAVVLFSNPTGDTILSVERLSDIEAPTDCN